MQDLTQHLAHYENKEFCITQQEQWKNYMVLFSVLI